MCRFVLHIHVTFNAPKRNLMHDSGLLVVFYLKTLDIRDCNNFAQILFMQLSFDQMIYIMVSKGGS